MAHFTDLIYTHQKTGKFYRIVHFAVAESTLQPVVIYKSLTDGSVWARPASEFFDGRFVTGGAEPGAADTNLSLKHGDREPSPAKVPNKAHGSAKMTLSEATAGLLKEDEPKDGKMLFPVDAKGYPLDGHGRRMMTKREMDFRNFAERKGSPVKPEEGVIDCPQCDGTGTYDDGKIKERCICCKGRGLMVIGATEEDDL